MTTSTLQKLTQLPYLGSAADNHLAELACSMARLARDVPGLTEAARQVVLARRRLRSALLLCDDLASDAIAQEESMTP